MIEDFFPYNLNKFKARINVPVFERICYLYSMGFANTDMVDILNTEYEDLIESPITLGKLELIISEHKAQLDIYSKEMGLSFREEIQGHIKVLYEKTCIKEKDIVEIYLDKIGQYLDELKTLDPAEEDEDGNFVNTSRIFVLHELIDKFHKSASKITGTEALRDIEIFRMKEEAKAAAAADKNNLLPSYGKAQPQGQTVEAFGTMVDE